MNTCMIDKVTYQGQYLVNIENEEQSLVIWSAVAQDAQKLTSWWNDGSVMAHAGFPKGLGQSIETTQKQIGQNQLQKSQCCMIEYKKDPIGELNFHIQEQEAEIGIKICEKVHQERGLGSQILTMLIEYLFTDPMINETNEIIKIVLDTNLKNERAQHVYEKIGFQKLRVNKDCWKDQIGELQSSVDYELTKQQYENGVRFVCNAADRREIATDILDHLPEWFGLPESTREYITNSQCLPISQHIARTNQLDLSC